jgi:hypothetical protein
MEEEMRTASVAASGHVNIDSELSGQDDADMLGKNSQRKEVRIVLIVAAKLGYKQELRRNFTLFEVFGIAFSIMGLLPSIASTLSYSLPAGPAGLVWVRDFKSVRPVQMKLIHKCRAGFWLACLSL